MKKQQLLYVPQSPGLGSLMKRSGVRSLLIYLITVVLFSGGAGVCELGVQWFPCQREPCHSVVLRHVRQETYDQVEFHSVPRVQFYIRQTDRQTDR